MTIDSPYLTTAEVAEIVRMDPDYVARQCAAGNLRAKKLGTQWRIHRDAVTAFMAGATKAEATRYRERRRAS